MAHEEAPTVTVTFLPAKSESRPESRAPTRAPMENTDTIEPYTITILNDRYYYKILMCGGTYHQCTRFNIISRGTLDTVCQVILNFLIEGDIECISKSMHLLHTIDGTFYNNGLRGKLHNII